MRVYLPATFKIAQELAENSQFTVRSGYGFALTPALKEFYTEGGDEEIAEFAFDDASRASLRLLAIGDEETFPYRRVVISADVPDTQITFDPDSGESVVVLNHGGRAHRRGPHRPTEGNHVMTGIITKGEKRLVIASGRAHPELAQEVASELGTEVLSSTAYDFANGETYVRFST